MASSSVRTAMFACRGDRPMAGATSAMSVLHPLSAFKTFSRTHSNVVNRRYSCRLGCTSCFTPSTRRRTSRRLQLMLQTRSDTRADDIARDSSSPRTRVQAHTPFI
ncbi:hypothetical protein EXIGLDRAFT_92044 [Exidia glandulosa HHB12029]|uniref:Uncharacterized protein n=1 Tax=Exidia glandulosa HHB12029 TaxID=1314781 RepID=A0A165H9G2_EXIGL|nr:hypothetical protein EXIGLDRAFT_92044 [Exidia glandulosa HHB12029]